MADWSDIADISVTSGRSMPTSPLDEALVLVGTQTEEKAKILAHDAYRPSEQISSAEQAPSRNSNQTRFSAAAAG